MKEPNEEITRLFTKRVIALLTEREEVTLPLIGRFSPSFVREYVVRSSDDTLTLYPPSVTLIFRPDPYLLDLSYYSTYDIEIPQEGVVPTALSRWIVDFYELEEKEVAGSISAFVTSFLTRLFRGRRVSLPSIGDFFVTEETEQLLVLNFDVSREALEALNHPFSAYDPITLPPGADVGDLPVLADLPKRSKSQFPVIEQPKRKQIDEHEDEKLNNDIETVPDHVSSLSEEKSPLLHVTESEVTQDSEHRAPGRKRRNYWVYGLGLVAVLTALLFLLFPRSQPHPDTSPLPEETIPEIPQETTTSPAEEIVLRKDTIAPGETLAKLSRKYYGVGDYWVYIFMQNSAVIEDPDNVPIGTILTIPDLKDYRLKEDLKSALREAKDWAYVILVGNYRDYESQRPELPSNKKAATE